MMAAALRFLGALSLPELPGIGALVSFFFTTALGRLTGVLLAAAALYLYAHHKGAVAARAECRDAALQARIHAVERDRDSANARAAREAARVVALERLRRDQEDQIAALRRRLEASPPGVKRDPLLDDQCRLTPRGAR